MKIQRIACTVSFGLALGLLTNVSLSSAQTETVTTSKTTTYSGVVSEINPSTSTIILKSQSSPAPVTYTFTKETTFVDSSGKTVSSEAIMNSPVTVEYATEGGRTVVRRVVQTGPAQMMEKSTTRTETETR